MAARGWGKRSYFWEGKEPDESQRVVGDRIYGRYIYDGDSCYCCHDNCPNNWCFTNDPDYYDDDGYSTDDSYRRYDSDY